MIKLYRVVEWITKERWAAFVTLVLAAIDLAVGFGLDLSGQQVAVLTGFLTSLGGFLIQAKVWSQRSHDRQVGNIRTLAFRAGRESMGTPRRGAPGPLQQAPSE